MTYGQALHGSPRTTVGLKVDLAEGGTQAVALTGQNRLGPILMDVQMPKLNGVETTRAIRDVPGYDQTSKYLHR